jgi:hypothetical protein
VCGFNFYHIANIRRGCFSSAGLAEVAYAVL